jgi:hypothetical protein
MDAFLADLAGSFARKCPDLSAYALAKEFARWHSLRGLYWNRAIGITLIGVSFSGE